MSGHMPNSGLQRHSIGDMYPLVSVVQTVQENTATEMLPRSVQYWFLLDTRTGHEITMIPDRAALDIAAQWLHQVRGRLSVTQTYKDWMEEL